MKGLVFTLLSVGFLSGILAQPASTIEFYDTTGTDVTGKVGWSGTKADGQMIIGTPADANAVTVKNSDVTVKGAVKAASFKGNGDSLTIVKLDSLIAQLQAVKTLLTAKSDTGHTHNVAIDSIPWSKLREIPAELADGKDSVGITVETDPTVPAALKDGISWTEITGIPADIADGDSVGSSVVETDPTVLASVKDGVSWAEVTGIPAQIADGIDSIGITAEADPTVLASVKDGVTWAELAGTSPFVTAHSDACPSSGCLTIDSGDVAPYTVKSVSITVARAGRVFVSVNGWVDNRVSVSNPDVYFVGMLTNSATTTISAFTNGSILYWGKHAYSGVLALPINATTSFVVPAAGTYTYYFLARHFITSCLRSVFQSCNMEAIFIPN